LFDPFFLGGAIMREESTTGTSSFPRLEDIAGFTTLPFGIRYEFLQRHYVEMIRALKEHEIVTPGCDRQKAIEICRAATQGLREEIRLAIRDNRTPRIAADR
jgi:hypothetical protein